MPKERQYRIRNWSEYNTSLIKRGSLTLWFDEESIKLWHELNITGARGRPAVYNDAAILCMLTLKSVFNLPLRATQGLVGSIIQMLDLPITAPNYSTVCRRQRNLNVTINRCKASEAIHAVFDSTGLKVFGEGEWKVRQHGYSKRRTWRKLHLGINEATGEIMAASLTTNDVGDGEVLPNLLEQISNVELSQVSADGAYDSFKNYQALSALYAKVTIPPRKGSKIKQHGNSEQEPLARDQNIRAIRKDGRCKWKKDNDYHRRSLAETTMFRFKQICGEKLSAILFENQAVEAFIKCNVLNTMFKIGRPDSYCVN
jgi:hypothetical protein